MSKPDKELLTGCSPLPHHMNSANLPIVHMVDCNGVKFARFSNPCDARLYWLAVHQLLNDREYHIKLEELVREYLENGHMFNCTVWHPDLDGNKICCCGYDALAKHIEDKP